MRGRCAKTATHDATSTARSPAGQPGRAVRAAGREFAADDTFAAGALLRARTTRTRTASVVYSRRLVLSDSEALREIVAAAARLNAMAGELTSLEFADERGWLGADDVASLKALADQFPIARAELAERWRRLDAGSIEVHAQRVHAVLDRMRLAGGKLGHFYQDSLEPRALATCSADRDFDFWAIYAVYQL